MEWSIGQLATRARLRSACKGRPCKHVTAKCGKCRGPNLRRPMSARGSAIPDRQQGGRGRHPPIQAAGRTVSFPLSSLLVLFLLEGGEKEIGEPYYDSWILRLREWTPDGDGTWIYL